MQKFSTGIILRVGLIFGFSYLGAYLWSHDQDGLAVFILILNVILAYNLYRYTSTINKKLSRIFDSIQYQDFAITFRADNAKGDSFEELNNSLNAVVKSFNQVRAEREATLHFIQAIIQQINVGILSYNTDGKIELVNQAANKLLSIYKLSHISSIKNQHPEIYHLMTNLPSGESKLLKVNNSELSLSVKEIILRDRKIRLIALHNIRTELQARELEAWQNLTKVLRHEIMNTVTPIVSLSETMKDIIEIDLQTVIDPQQKSGVEDLKNAIHTVINRSKGIMNFVNAYREFTNIPVPNLSEVLVSTLFHNVQALYETRHSQSIRFDIIQDFTILADPDQIEQVLINIIKNAIEATEKTQNSMISIKAFMDHQAKTIEVCDNGEGVTPEDSEKIFVPFFTSKPSGTGIGLSLSRQIMQMHGGTLEYLPNKPEGSKFVLIFN
ncbi:MAG: GHKL domain-containing protein [Saprospiraceae bacterium]|nr:GHKL domain-containing protein [Saprospiraceae bacterium]MBP6566982.1 GHKL domain-containing protein [Saprospiraceae bacterium]